jgi:hypothetical protein
MPPSVSVPLTTLFLLAFWLVLGTLTPAAFAGFLAGYLFYEHDALPTHHGPARTAVGRDRCRRHFRYHVIDSTDDYSVSSPLWDVVLGTRGRRLPIEPAACTCDRFRARRLLHLTRVS